MMKSFSKFNLLKEKLNPKKKSLLDIILQPKNQYIQIEVSYYDFLRGKVLLEDMEMVAEDSPKIDLGELIYLLYIQFLFQARSGTDISTLSHNIVLKMEALNLFESPTRKKEQKLTGVSPTLFMLQEYEVTEERKQQTEKIACIPIRIKTHEVYRGEILLNDIYNLNPDYTFTVENKAQVNT